MGTKRNARRGNQAKPSLASAVAGGVFSGAFFCAVALIIDLATDGGAQRRLGVSMSRVALMYLASGAIGGVLFALIVPHVRGRASAYAAGWLIGLPGSVLLSVPFGGWPGQWGAFGWMVAAIGAALIGRGVAEVWILD